MPAPWYVREVRGRLLGMIVLALVSSGGLLLPTATHAEVIITEIMYDVPGANAHKQWVEIQNTGTSPEDLGTKDVRLVDHSGKHLLTTSQGSAILGPQSVAIVAQDPSNFLSAFPEYAGTLFKSSFSLTAAGSLFIASSKNITGSMATYDSSQGAKGDGNSLQLSGTTFVPAAPTPGVVPAILPAAIVAPPKLSKGTSGSTKQATHTTKSSPTKRTKKNSSSTYDSGSLAPAATADVAAAGAPFSPLNVLFAPLGMYLGPYSYLLSSWWFAGFLGLIAFSAFSLFMVQRHNKA